MEDTRTLESLRKTLEHITKGKTLEERKSLLQRLTERLRATFPKC